MVAIGYEAITTRTTPTAASTKPAVSLPRDWRKRSALAEYGLPSSALNDLSL